MADRAQARQKMMKFLSARRQQIKSVKGFASQSENLTKLMIEGKSASFRDQVLKNKRSDIYNFFLSQDDLLKSPIILALEQQKWEEFIKTINQWSRINQQFFYSKLNSTLSNEINSFYQGLLRNIIKSTLTKQQQQFQKIIEMFTQKYSIMGWLISQFMSLSMLLDTIPQKLQLQYIQGIYLPIARRQEKNSGLIEQLTKFVTISKRDKTWREMKFLEMLANPEILTLKEMNYNFMHELVLKKEDKKILQILAKINQSGNSDIEGSQTIEQYFCSFDSGGETPIDLILSKWSFQPIKKFIEAARQIQQIHFSINSINKILSNNNFSQDKKLKQNYYEDLIQEVLNGEIAERGYVQQIYKQKKVKLKANETVIKRQSSQYVIVMDTRRLLMAKDKRQSYPLLNYLDKFKSSASLQKIPQLLPPPLTRQPIKTKVISILKLTGIECKIYEVNNEGLKQIEDVIYYHQSLLNYICRLPHNDILEFFVDKLFINYFTISIWSKTNGNPVLHMVNRHFITNYVENNGNLGDDQIDRKILGKVFEAKDNQKFVGNFNMYVELLRQFSQSKIMAQDNQWLTQQIKLNIKKYFKTLGKQKFRELYTYFNEGQKQRKVGLVQLLPNIFTQEQIKALQIPPEVKIKQAEKEEPEKQKPKQKPCPQNKLKQYWHNRTLENFKVQITSQTQKKEKTDLAWIETQKKQAEKKGKQEADENNEDEAEEEHKQYYTWQLLLHQPDLQVKFNQLLKEGYRVQFNLTRAPIKTKVVKKDRKQNTDVNLKQPLQTIAKYMLKPCSQISNKLSLPSHVACMICQNEDVDKIYSFLESSSQKFRQSFGGIKSLNELKLHANPLLLLKMSKSEKLKKIYRMDKLEGEDKYELCANIRGGLTDITMSIKSSTQIEKALAYKQLIFNLNILQDVVSQMRHYLILQSSKIDLSEIYNNLSIDQIIKMGQNKIYINYLLISKDALKKICMVNEKYSKNEPIYQKAKQRLSEISAKLNSNYQNRDEQNVRMLQKQRDKYKQQCDQWDRYFANFVDLENSEPLANFCSVLDKLSDEQYEKYFKQFPFKSLKTYMILFRKLADEKKHLKTLNILIDQLNDQASKKKEKEVELKEKQTDTESQEKQEQQKNVDGNQNQNEDHKKGLDQREQAEAEDKNEAEQQINSEMNIDKFLSQIPSMVKQSYDNFNCALFAFGLSNQLIHIKNMNVSPSKKIIIESREFLKYCKLDTFKVYVEYLTKMLTFKRRDLCETKQAKLTDIFRQLYHGEQWSKIILILQKVKQIQKEIFNTVKTYKKTGFNVIVQFLIKAFKLLGGNQSRVVQYKSKSEYEKIPNLLFKIAQQSGVKNNQILFENAWKLNPKQAVKSIKIKKIDIMRLARCLNGHPSQFELLKQIKISKKNKPHSYKATEEGRYLPLHAYSVHDFDKNPYLVDLMIFEEKIKQKWLINRRQNIGKYVNAFEQKKKSVFLVPQIMKRHNQVYTSQQVQKLSSQIFASNTLQSVKQIPKQYLDAYFRTHTQIHGINNLKEQVIKQLIDMNYVTRKHTLEIIKSSKMEIIDYFFNKLNIKFDYALIEEMTKERLQRSSFINALMYLENDGFVETFVKKYGVFDLYPEQTYYQMTRQVLWQIAAFKKTQFLKLFLQHLKLKLKLNQLTFEQGPINSQLQSQNMDSTMQEYNGLYPQQFYQHGVRNGIVYLPVAMAAYTNFYEYHFLLLQCDKQSKTPFVASDRFKFQFDPNKYSFIPLMKNKLQLLAAVKNIIKNSKHRQDNNYSTAFKAIFLFSEEQPKGFYHFLKSVSENTLRTKNLKDNYLAILYAKTHLKDAPIPDQKLLKKFPNEGHFIIQLLKVWPLKLQNSLQFEQVLAEQEVLKSLIFEANPSYLAKSSISSIIHHIMLYSKAFRMHIKYFQKPQNANFMEKFIENCYFNIQVRSIEQEETEVPLQEEVVSFIDQRQKDMLICMIVSKFQGNGTALKHFCKFAKQTQDQLMWSIAFKLCNFSFSNEVQNLNIRYNFALWNKMLENLVEIDKISKFQKKSPVQISLPEKYKELVMYQENKSSLNKICEGLHSVYSALVVLSSTLYIISEQQYLKGIVEQYAGDKQSKVRIIIQKNYQIEEKVDQKLVLLRLPLAIRDNPPIKILQIDTDKLKYFFEQKMCLKTIQLGQKLVDDCECLSKLQFEVNIESFKKVNQLQLLKRMVTSSTETSSLAFRLIEQINRLNYLLEQFKESKIYSLSDVFGPVVINDQTDKNKVIQCLSFYELCKLPNSKITIEYTQNPIKNEKYLLSDLKQYIRFFKFEVNDDQSENKSPYKFNSKIYVSPKKSNPSSFEIIMDQFYIWNIIRFMQKLIKYGNQMSFTFNNQIIFKYQALSLMKMAEIYQKQLNTSDDLLFFVSSILSNRRHIDFIQTLLIMIAEDARNIMKAVKGILLIFDYSEKHTTISGQSTYKISDKFSYYGISYKIDDLVFKISVKTGPSKKQQSQIRVYDTNLISRKDFLNSIFSSVQFLVGYFINKSTLGNELVKMSRNVSQKVNSEVSISINYKQLQNYVQKIKQKLSIKQLDGILTNLNKYLTTNFENFVMSYINSKQLAVLHQILLINCFEKLSTQEGPLKNQIRVRVQEDLQAGITQIYNFTSQLKNQNSSKETNIKNMYLIQIYKSCFASVVQQGMTFILGYKANRPPMVIQLQKKQDIDRVNIIQLSFLLLISNRVPTNDQINHSKIIRLFVADLNENVYQISKSLTTKLLSLPQQSQDRTLAHLVPVLESNVILVFSSEFSGDQAELKDDQNHRYLELVLQKQQKFKFRIKNKPVICCSDLLKIDTNFTTILHNLTSSIKSHISKNITISIKVPPKYELQRAIQILNSAFVDMEVMFNNIFYEPIRNKYLELFVSAQLGEDIRENLVMWERCRIFQECWEQICFQIAEVGESKIQFEGRVIRVVLVGGSNRKINANIICDQILKKQIDLFLQKNEKVKKVYEFHNNQEDLLSKLDHFLISKYQIQTIEKVLKILKSSGLAKTSLSNYKIILVPDEKSALKFDKQVLTLNIRLKSPTRQYFSSSEIIQFIINNFKPTIEGILSSQYDAITQNIQFQNFDLERPVKILLVSKDKTQVLDVQLKGNEKNTRKSIVNFKRNQEISYFAIQKQNQAFNVIENYFWSIDPNTEYINKKDNKKTTKQKIYLLLKSPTSINMGQCMISTQVHATKNEKPDDLTNITKKIASVTTHAYLLSKDILKLQLTPNISSNIKIHLGKFRMVSNQEVQIISLSCTSAQNMVQQNTKFVELIFRNKSLKPLTINETDKQVNATFNQPAQKQAIIANAQKKKQRSVQQMVYIVNQNARKYLTRAGQVRIDVINVCDAEGNAINFNPANKIYFRHLNIQSCVIVPQIITDNDSPRVELKWTPTYRGPYQVFLNNTRLNPNYQIGVCAAVVDISVCKVDPPKKTEICFLEETQCTIFLKDNFGNIYTELQEAFINDPLLINLESPQISQNNIKIRAQKIDKYGLKKIRFSVDDPNSAEARNIGIKLSINMQQISEFNLMIKGQSLEKRRKNLQKQIQSVTKRHSIQINVSRNNFLQSLFKIADKSLDKTFSVRFVGEQGIDAGGLKRQFYDMIGKQMKDPQNPFFINTDRSRHNQYFINPELMKNKKKLEYMNLFGKYLANSLINGYLIGINFSPTFIKLLYNDPITFQDMLSVLPKQEASRYEYLVNADANYIQDLQIYFSCIFNRKKGIEVQMIENGKNVKVTKQNIGQYLKILPDFLIVQRYREVIESFRQGFQSVFKIEIVRKWIRTDQFWCMTAGVKEITPEIVLNYVVIRGGKETHHSWFRTYITEASQEILQGFLKFSSGSSSIDFYQSSKITVQFQNQGENPKKLPISHTCWKQIQIPAYKSYPILKQLLNAAFLYCSEGFGFG